MKSAYGSICMSDAPSALVRGGDGEEDPGVGGKTGVAWDMRSSTGSTVGGEGERLRRK